MPTLKIIVGEEVVHEFDLDRVSTGIVASLGAHEAQGNELVEKPPVGVSVSAFTVTQDDQVFWFFDMNGPEFSNYPRIVSQSQHNKSDCSFVFPAKYNPRYADKK